jgi:nucleoside-diphosphate-sugar epimerase
MYYTMQHKQPTIAITGATGFLGSVLVTHFASKGWQVIGLVRTPPKDTKQATYRRYDISKPFAADALADVDYVVHAAYVKYSQQNTDAMQTNITGARHLLAACKAAHVKKALFISTMSAHDEATSVYGKQKLAIEQLFVKAGGIALRSGLILGHGGIVQDMAKFMKSKHIVPVIGGGRQPLQTIAVYDLAHVIEAALTQKVEGVLTVATPQIYSYKAFYQALARSIGTKVLFVPVSYHLLLAMFNTAAALKLPLSLGADNLRGLKQLRSAETAKDLKRLGITIDDLETALKKINTK